MKPIGIEDILSLNRSQQVFHDCYLVSSINALSRSENGRKILQNNIAREGNNFRIRFQNVNQNVEDFFVTEIEIKDLTPMDKFLNPVESPPPRHPVIEAIEVAMNKLLSKYPDNKPLSSRLYGCHEKFEYNSPSNFLGIFTGKKPIVLNEKTLRMSLKSKRKEAMELLEKIGASGENNCFVIGSGHNFIKGITNWHCYNIEKVDLQNKTAQIFDNKYQVELTMPLEDIIRKFKYITGYFDENLK